MEARLQRRIQRYGWDKAADYYEQCWQKQLEPAQIRMLDMANPQTGERVLDVACGTGLVTFRAAAEVTHTGEVVGTDISDRMVEFSKELAKRLNINHAIFEQMDAEALRFPDGSFDAVVCALGLMYVPDPLKSLREMHRVLKPGGRAAAAVWGQRNRCGWAEIFPIVDARVNTEVCPLFFQLGTGDLLKRTFEEAGFENVVSERLSTTLHYDSQDAACGAAFVGGPVAMAYSRFDENTKQEAFAEYLASIEPYKNGRGYQIPGEFVIVSGRKE